MKSLLQIHLGSLRFLMNIRRFSHVPSHTKIIIGHCDCPIILFVVEVWPFCDHVRVIHIVWLLFLDRFNWLHSCNPFFSVMENCLLCVQQLPAFLEGSDDVNVFANFSSFD